MPTRTKANVPCSLPFTFVNGTVADATQVNANYNALVTCLGQAAIAGVNGDITQLTGLTTPITPASGGTAEFTATAATTGTPNAQVIAATLPNNFSLNTGYRVSFISGGSNTGATTLNVAATGVKNVFRKSTAGAVAMVGGELIVGAAYVATYDGTEFVLMGDTAQVGQMADWHASTPPAGWLISDGSCYTGTNPPYVALFAIISTTYGNCGANTFIVPDLRGRVATGLDNMGPGGAAGRLTNVASGCGSNFLTAGASCASFGQSHVLTTAEIPASPNVGGASFTGNSQTPGTNQSGIMTNATTNITGWTGAGSPTYFVGGNGTGASIGQATITFTPTGSVTLGNMGSGGGHPTGAPNFGFYKMIKL
jgi:microcystin-dependent protein